MTTISTSATDAKTITDAMHSMILTPEEMRDLSQDLGGHWFDDATMRYFGMRMSSVSTPVKVMSTEDSAEWLFIWRGYADHTQTTRNYRVERFSLWVTQRKDGRYIVQHDITPVCDDYNERVTFTSRKAALAYITGE